jgi:peroxiredoxin Q/BCP
MKITAPFRHPAWLLTLCLGCQRTTATSKSTSEPTPQASESPASPRVQLEVGDHVPNLTLTTQSGAKLDLDSLRGKRVVLYFYPQDQTKGCTIEARGIRDSFAEFERKGIVVLGVSMQDAESHQQFIAAEQLPFDLVVDTSGDVARAFGVQIQNGRAARDTILFDEHGLIRKIWRGVSPVDHAKRVLDEIATW